MNALGISLEMAMLIGLFTLAAIALFRSNQERHSIVFMVRSKFGIKLIT